MAWYFKGFGLGRETRRALGMVSSFDELDGIFARLDASETFPMGGGRHASRPAGHPPRPRHRAHGWLDSQCLDASVDLADAESDASASGARFSGFCNTGLMSVVDILLLVLGLAALIGGSFLKHRGTRCEATACTRASPLD